MSPLMGLIPIEPTAPYPFAVHESTFLYLVDPDVAFTICGRKCDRYSHAYDGKFFISQLQNHGSAQGCARGRFPPTGTVRR